MSVVVPELATRIQSGEFLRGKTVDVADWKTLGEELNRIFARSGGASQGFVFDTPFATASASYTRASSSASNNLNIWTGLLRLERAAVSDNARIRFVGFGVNVDVRVNVTRFDTAGVTTSTFTASSGGTLDWFTGTGTFSNSNKRVDANLANEPANFGLDIEAKAQSGTASLWGFLLDEDILVAGNIR